MKRLSAQLTCPNTKMHTPKPNEYATGRRAVQSRADEIVFPHTYIYIAETGRVVGSLSSAGDWTVA